VKINVAPLLKQRVGAQADYQLTESPIDPRGENGGLTEAGATSIDAEIVATHTNPGAYLEGDARATISEVCSRCLRPIETPKEAPHEQASSDGRQGAPVCAGGWTRACQHDPRVRRVRRSRTARRTARCLRRRTCPGRAMPCPLATISPSSGTVVSSRIRRIRSISRRE